LELLGVAVRFVVSCESTIRRTLYACDGDHIDAVLLDRLLSVACRYRAAGC
jgi:hypothetical protein